MSKELYEATIEYTKNYNGESWIATISDEKYIDMDTFERVKADLEAKLAESKTDLSLARNEINTLRCNMDIVKKHDADLYELFFKKGEELVKLDKSWQDLNYKLSVKDDEIKQLKQQLAEKEKELSTQKIEKLYRELLFTRLQWIHKEADECREEKERFGGIEDMALSSVWGVLDLQKHECCGYEEMAELEDAIGYIAEDKLLRTIEHDLKFRATRTENEILDEIKALTHKHEDKGE